MRKYFKFLVLLFPLIIQAQYPVAVEANLKKAGNNRPELEKAIEYCTKTGDSLKIKAIHFLIANMDIHHSADYFWENKEGLKINFNELDYPDINQATKAFETVKSKNTELSAKSFTSNDLETIKAEFLIDNLEKAFAAWKNSPAQNITFDSFCEYILPYRISVEPLQSWRTDYTTKYEWVKEKIQTHGLEAGLLYIKDETQSWFANTWGKGGRKDPLPRLGSQQLLFRKQGACADQADLGVFIMRGLGIPATINAVPYWATSTGGHYVNTFFDTNSKPIAFDFGAKTDKLQFVREPAKVLRITYSKQPNALTVYESENNIPNGFLREPNYIDVTQDFWQTTSVKSTLYPNEAKPKTVYIATFNGLNWKPFWWGKITNNQTQWDQICVETVILPQYYLGGKMIPAATPILVGEKANRVLTPNLKQLQPLTITSAEGYLRIKPNVSYKLYYWNDGWKLIAIKTATQDTTSLLYEKVPQNALLLLLASDTIGLERPFVVDEKGNRTWY